MTMTEYQELALKSDKTGGDVLKSLMIILLGLSGEVGSLLSEYKKWLREGQSYRPFTDQVSEELGDILWYLANLASKLNLDLGEIANENIAKIEERFPGHSHGSGLFGEMAHRYDSAFEPHEQLPLLLRVDLVEEACNRLVIRRDGHVVGDSLTDNSHIVDGYRYHDVFHVGCAIILGWSPVMRRILKCKRKSVPVIDEVEDGARALVTEEGVSAVVFGYARDYSMFANSSSLDYEILRTVRGMTRPFEVRTRSLADWEKTILASYKVWRQLQEYRGGTIVGDANSQTLAFEPPTW
jgi:NTP pyrophosphatase (non-canonical NTP hydrolase)